MAVSLNRLVFSRLTIWVLMTLFGAYFVYSIKQNNEKNFFHLRYGIDLVGGTFITLEVQLAKAQAMELNEKMKDFTDLLRNNGKPLPVEKKISGDAIQMTFSSMQDAADAKDFLMERDPSSLFEHTNTQLAVQFSAQQIKEINTNAIEGNILALHSRMNQFGVGEIYISRQGESRIIVELPNVHNPQQAKAMIGKAALLEIKPVEAMAASKEELLNKYDGELPEGTEIVPGKPGSKEFYLVSQYTDVTGRQLKNAKQDFGGPVMSEPVVEFEFKPAGAERFYEMTSNNIGKHLAIIIDGVVISVPVVNVAIRDKGIISGNFTAQSAQELALLLRSGAFVAPVKFEEERTVGATLGQESIYQGLMACVVGLILVFIFSVVVYKMAGVLACIVLIYNLLLTLLFMWALGATLTMPGIAGMILTIGMAIDASILIYERMRELLAEKVTLRKAIDEGFAGAFEVIFDSNITNLLIAIVLYYLGTGPIQGFAVTMIVGIVATLITGLWLLRSFFTFATDVLGINKISI